MRWLLLCAALLPLPAFAQDKAQTLADLQAELAKLSADDKAICAGAISAYKKIREVTHLGELFCRRKAFVRRAGHGVQMSVGLSRPSKWLDA